DRWVYGMLKVVGLEDAFQAVVTSSDVKHGKPAPDVYLRCAEKLGVDPARCLALEDSCYGLQAAKAAGMTCYVVPSELTCRQDLSLADGRLDSLEDLDLNCLSDTDVSLAEAPAL
ncbi:MAG TPA: HAD-IA family hydrolase, partial [Armatimonadota bacterium]